MLDQMNDQGTTEGSPRWMGIAVVGLAILSLVGVGLAWNAGGHARDAEQALSAQAKTFQASEDGMSQRMAQAERTNAELQSEVNLVGDKLKLTEDQLATARSQVKQSRADYTKKLNDVQSTLATKASADDVKALGTERQRREDRSHQHQGKHRSTARRARRIDRAQPRRTRAAQANGRARLL